RGHNGDGGGHVPRRLIRGVVTSGNMSSRTSIADSTAACASYSRVPPDRTAEHRVHARVGDAIEHVRRVDPPVQVEPRAPGEGAGEPRVQPELRGAGDGVPARASPVAWRRRGERGRVQI